MLSRRAHVYRAGYCVMLYTLDNQRHRKEEVMLFVVVCTDGRYYVFISNTVPSQLTSSLLEVSPLYLKPSAAKSKHLFDLL